MTLAESQANMRQAIKEACQYLAMTIHTGGPKSFGGALKFASICSFVKPTDMWCDAHGDLIALGLTEKQCDYICGFMVGMTHASGKVEVFDGRTITVR